MSLFSNSKKRDVVMTKVGKSIIDWHKGVG